MTPRSFRSLVVAAAALAPLLTLAQTATASGLHPWEVPTPRLKADAYFTNLKDGDQIETPYVLKFGLSGGWGLAPVAKPSSGKAGHHHLLVNRDLPLNFKEALPFNDQYIHFGGGQMETVLTFEPGTYTLRMLLANQQHLPHFVYSKPARITVTKKNPSDPKSLQTAGISLMLPPGEVRAPFRVQFHASKLNVARLDQQLPDTGHFKLQVTSTSGSGNADLNYTNGQTEVHLSPPPGTYRLQLLWVDNITGRTDVIEPATAQVQVVGR
ncbi:DUF4399 domain-containing protein [Hydrogenophaga sp.]|jgi:hypothetical protein|uniref:DUF4399 domain-containing protein n=1 Tax=Hydrogenophaga sp. TaxID=1904254 RepID=UPI00262CC1D8|nr:DUF4399 domain-containing protein [Hydrogenophaga sp.]MDM7948355.1 DUF4399 domain-containing protein [Hydrogenophaga sp.]